MPALQPSKPLRQRPRRCNFPRVAGLTTATLLCCLGATSHLAGPVQAQPQPTLPSFSDVIDVRVINLEVVVTDRKGNRIHGLGPEDFLLKVDGREVAIDYFSEIQEGTSQAAAATGSVPLVPSLEPGSQLRTNYLIFVDDYFAIARDRNRVLTRLQQDLAQSSPRDRFAIVAFDGKKLDLLSSWTTDHDELGAALDRARDRKAYGQQRIAELRVNDDQRLQRREMRQLTVQAAGDELGSGSFFDSRLDGAELEYANRLTEQVTRSVLAAASALRSFAAPDGRKVMLLLSGGWPFSPAEYTLNDFQADGLEAMSGSDDRFLGGRNRLFTPLTNTANLLSYTLYPVDVPGLRRTFSIDASVDFTQVARTVNVDGGGAGGSATPREHAVHDGLSFLAKETGGRALLNAQRDRSLSEVIEDTRSFYWLGFTPDRREDDQRHDIEIEIVGRPDLRVRARDGYVDLSRGTEVTMMVESALLFGDPPSNKPLLLKFGRPKRGGRGKMWVPLEVGMSMDEITLLETAGRFVNELEIRVTVMDKIGNRSQTVLDRIEIDGGEPPRPGQIYYYVTQLLLRKKEHRIVVAVYDPLSGSILSSSGEISGL